MKIVVVSPHRDDAAFSLSFAIESWIKDGHAVTVMNCFTRSEYAPFSDSESLHTNDRMSFVSALRKREDEDWSRRFGPKLTLTELNLKDAPLRLHCTADDVCTMTVDPNEKGSLKIAKAITQLRADALVLPLAEGNHIDHLTTREAALQSGTQIPYAFYEDLPYLARPGGEEQLQGVLRDVARETRAELSPVFASAPREDVAAAIKHKRRLALCYDSQINDDTATQIAEYCEHYQGRERIWATEKWTALPWKA